MYENIHYIHSGKFSSKSPFCHPERVIDSYELIIVTSGTLYIKVESLDYMLTKGDVLRIDPGALHSGTRMSDSGVSFFWVHFYTDDKDLLPPRYLRPESFSQAELLCKQMLHYSNTEGYPAEAPDLLLRLLIIELTTENLRRIASSDKLYSEICEWVKKYAEKAVKVSDVAESLGYNEDYISRVFRKYYPKGLKLYIAAAKLDKIKNDLIKGSLSLGEISDKYGFSEYKYFLKFFKYHVGVSPTAYKQLYYNVQTGR